MRRSVGVLGWGKFIGNCGELNGSIISLKSVSFVTKTAKHYLKVCFMVFFCGNIDCFLQTDTAGSSWRRKASLASTVILKSVLSASSVEEECVWATRSVLILLWACWEGNMNQYLFEIIASTATVHFKLKLLKVPSLFPYSLHWAKFALVNVFFFFFTLTLPYSESEC